uniref:Uncharacterized protein n=1 Tax=Magallana gigas TaxID=29159 RepID=K1R2V5_MAGGI
MVTGQIVIDGEQQETGQLLPSISPHPITDKPNTMASVVIAIDESETSDIAFECFW